MDVTDTAIAAHTQDLGRNLVPLGTSQSFGSIKSPGRLACSNFGTGFALLFCGAPDYLWWKTLENVRNMSLGNQVDNATRAAVAVDLHRTMACITIDQVVSLAMSIRVRGRDTDYRAMRRDIIDNVLQIMHASNVFTFNNSFVARSAERDRSRVRDTNVAAGGRRKADWISEDEYKKVLGHLREILVYFMHLERWSYLPRILTRLVRQDPLEAIHIALNHENVVLDWFDTLELLYQSPQDAPALLERLASIVRTGIAVALATEAYMRTTPSANDTDVVDALLVYASAEETKYNGSAFTQHDLLPCPADTMSARELVQYAMYNITTSYKREPIDFREAKNPFENPVYDERIIQRPSVYTNIPYSIARELLPFTFDRTSGTVDIENEISLFLTKSGVDVRRAVEDDETRSKKFKTSQGALWTMVDLAHKGGFPVVASTITSNGIYKTSYEHFLFDARQGEYPREHAGGGTIGVYYAPYLRTPAIHWVRAPDMQSWLDHAVLPGTLYFIDTHSVMNTDGEHRRAKEYKGLAPEMGAIITFSADPREMERATPDARRAKLKEMVSKMAKVIDTFISGLTPQEVDARRKRYHQRLSRENIQTFVRGQANIAAMATENEMNIYVPGTNEASLGGTYNNPARVMFRDYQEKISPVDTPEETQSKLYENDLWTKVVRPRIERAIQQFADAGIE